MRLRLLGKAPCSLSKVVICVTKEYELFLENTTDTDVTIGPGELFGFGLGTFQETPLGQTTFKPT